MSFRTRLFGGAAALGLALTGWGVMGGASPADADDCTPLAAGTELCILNYSGPGFLQLGAVLAGPYESPPYTGVLVECYADFGTPTLDYAVNGDLSFVALPVELKPILCP